MATRAESLLPGDVAVAIELALRPAQSYEQLAEQLGVSTSAAHRAVKRLERARLLVPGKKRAMLTPLRDFIAHGLRHAFFADPGPEASGIPTAHSAPPIASEFSYDESYVWPSPRGRVRGRAVVPLYRQARELPIRNPELYRALALLDAIRVGRARERKRALELLDEMLLAA